MPSLLFPYCLTDSAGASYHSYNFVVPRLRSQEQLFNASMFMCIANSKSLVTVLFPNPDDEIKQNTSATAYAKTRPAHQLGKLENESDEILTAGRMPPNLRLRHSPTLRMFIYIL